MKFTRFSVFMLMVVAAGVAAAQVSRPLPASSNNNYSALGAKLIMPVIPPNYTVADINYIVNQGMSTGSIVIPSPAAARGTFATDYQAYTLFPYGVSPGLQFVRMSFVCVWGMGVPGYDVNAAVGNYPQGSNCPAGSGAMNIIQSFGMIESPGSS